MTLIVGLKCEGVIALAAETEEAAGITAKRRVHKLDRVTGSDWAVVLGAAGDSIIAANATRRIKQEISAITTLTPDCLGDILDRTLASIYEKYIDPDPKSEGIAFVLGAVCSNGELCLVSTDRRTHQFHDDQNPYAYAGIGADLAIFFLENLYDEFLSWRHAASIAGFVVYQATETSQYCSGLVQLYVLQSPPNPRWRALSVESALEIHNVCSSMMKEALSNISEQLERIHHGPHTPIDPGDDYEDDYEEEGKE